MTRLILAVVVFAAALCPVTLYAQVNAGPRSVYGPAPAGGANANAVPYAARQASDVQPIVEPAVPRGGPAAVPQPGIAPVAPQVPEWAGRMTAEENKWVDDVLKYWEARSDKVKLFECKFQRWDYDGGFIGPNQQRQPRTYSEGAIKYAQPDKGLFKIEKLVSVLPGANGGPPQNIPQNPELGEHWICDGKKIISFEANKKQVVETQLPPEMQGRAITDGPLPFMFGARAETIKARYWVRGLPNGPEKKYWLEAVPKSREDAQNFKQVRIVLDQQDYLPESLEIFSPNYNPPQNDARQTYRFTERAAKDAANLADLVKLGLDPLKFWNREFFNPAIPTGWKKVVQDPGGNIPAPPPQQAGAPAAPQKPSGPKAR
jgi:TIGR03009 family protein